MNITLQSSKMIGAGLATIGLIGVGIGIGIIWVKGWWIFVIVYYKIVSLLS